jgi:hypothetical protein
MSISYSRHVVTAGTRIAELHATLQEGVKAILIAHGKLEGALVSRNNKDFSYAVQQHGAAPAKRQVLFDLATQLVVQVSINIGRQTPG